LWKRDTYDELDMDSFYSVFIDKVLTDLGYTSANRPAVDLMYLGCTGACLDKQYSFRSIKFVVNMDVSKH
jgi:hypothetical protein